MLMELINCNPIYCARSRFPLLVAFKTHSPLSTFQCIDKNHLQRGRCERFYLTYFAGLKRGLSFFVPLNFEIILFLCPSFTQVHGLSSFERQGY